MTSNESSPKRKRRDITPLFILLILFPYIVGFSSDSTLAYTEYSFGAGGGRYVYKDCSGAHKQPFADGGAFIRKKYEGPYRIGLGLGGWSSGEKGSYVIAVPELALDWRSFSIGTTGLRLGAYDDLYLEGRIFDLPPFFSGSGGLRFGVGKKLQDSNTRIWIGSNVFPYHTAGIATLIDFPIGTDTYMFINGRYGKERESNIEEFGLSVGIRLLSY